MKSAVAASIMAALVLPNVAANAAESDKQRIERLERQIEELSREVKELKDHQKEEAEAKSAVPATPASTPPAATASAAPSTGAATASSTAETALAAIRDRVQLGGYGSTRFETNSATNENTTFTLRRLVLTADAAIAPRLRSYLELEFERFRELELERKVISENHGLTIKQSVEGTNESEIELEQAWLEYAITEPMKLRAGAMLVPLGRFNLNHDDNRWDIARRPLIDRGSPVLPVPAAWDEVGAGVLGEIALGEQGSLGYQLYAMNGAILEPEVETELENPNEEGARELAVEAEFRTQNGTFGKDVKSAKALAGRLVYSPRLGQELGASFYHGRYTPDTLPSEALNAFGIDGLSIWGPFELEAEYLYADYGDVANVARGFARKLNSEEVAIEGAELETVMEFALDSLADEKQGYWIESRYRFRPEWLKQSILGRGFEDPVLTAVVRAEQVWFQDRLDELAFSSGQVVDVSRSDRRIDRFTIGGSYRPVPLVAFQLAYEYTHVDKGPLSEVTNYLDTSEGHANAVLVGAAFGF
jgi:hypothetical protein